jgi:flagellar protein FlaG
VEQIDSYLKAARRELQFQVDEESGEVIVRVRDPATGEVIRQIPGDEVLRMARAMQDKTPMLLDLVV